MFSIFFTKSLGRPHSLDNTGMGGSTRHLMALQMVIWNDFKKTGKI